MKERDRGKRGRRAGTTDKILGCLITLAGTRTDNGSSASKNNVSIERRLKESEERCRSLFENSREAMFVMTRQGKIMKANPAFLNLFGYTEDDIKRMDDRELYGYSDQYAGIQAELKKTGTVDDFPMGLRTKDGATIDCLATFRPIKTAEGRITGYEGSIRDISDHKRLEAKVLHMRKLEAVGTLSASIAHDFNNVLTVVLGYAGILEMRIGRGQPDLADPLNHIITACQRASHLTNSLLVFSRKQAMHQKPLRINQLVRGVERVAGTLIGQDIELRLGLAENDPVIMADVAQMEQIFMNLIMNARDAMPHGGVLSLWTESVELNQEFVNQHGYGIPGRYVRITVMDTGTGMDKSVREKVFEPFFTTKESGKGTGLGLSIVYGLVKQHDGYINLHSHPGAGTIFNVYLPVKVDEAEREKLVSLSKPPGANKTVLLMADDETTPVIREVLREFRYSVIECVGKEEVLREFGKLGANIGMAILDVSVTKKDVKTFREEVRSMMADLPVLLIGTAPIIGNGKEDETAEMFYFISKPVFLCNLLNLLRHLQGKRHNIQNLSIVGKPCCVEDSLSMSATSSVM